MYQHPEMRMELVRLKQAELIAAGEASRAAARVGGDERVERRWLARLTQAKILRPWSRAATASTGAGDLTGAQRVLEIVRIRHRIRDLSAHLRRALGSQEPRAYQLELEGPILIRYSGVGDQAALERLAALDSRTLPQGSFLLAEIDGELVAAAPIDVDAEPVSDPFRPTANLRELLKLQAGHVRRQRDALPRPARAACRALPDTA